MVKPLSSELVLRINSALVMVVLTLALTYAGTTTFAGLILFAAALMSWEWGRVVRGSNIDRIFVIQTVAIIAAGYATLMGERVLAIALIVLATWLVFRLHKNSELTSDPWWSAAGVYYAGFPAIALIAIRQDPDYGFHAIIYLFLVVWSADTGAFFVGKLLGGPKLAPSISPNKTWSGFIGGAATAGLAGVLFALWFEHTSVEIMAGLSVLLAIVSMGGDLGESFIKRAFGVKNSSGLIPGHGGVLDRLDGLVFAAMGAGLIAAAADPLKPGRALLIW
ncbi:phosphatidate cytidylyltransferase [Rhodomicrobium vannielii ATCC 17100]|jgi:phosphatidate cytidylyltransferase|uniref:Phosphatidate cytidylyltransferase n=1 Tax=Rhodomicrobium vannielii (strain ATCC 17100 / DSM 162 / LMG 4299 / NCIMB 10020 / ATH 3.1.1) TaxID=648757 RepID=E3I1E4_RHOVT|nr:phosphatidate cytidylyltransferase [Rhodomicrobium vannielii]ADP71235.1 phosphatidate cytidylyltransferase [Rhodomicrobium vannielii ATCC 17100]